MTAPYYSDDSVTLYLGDCREVLPTLDVEPDCVIADPPYGETGLAWDRWPAGWPSAVASAGHRSMWCFGSMRMFMTRVSEFACWSMSQDVVWEKNAGTGMASDRLRRVHEHVVHWYRGRWSGVYHVTPRVAYDGPHKGFVRANPRIGHLSGGSIESGVWADDGTRQVRSVLKVQNLRGAAVHPTEKPVDLIDPLIRYACQPGGLVLDPFAGSGSTGVAARMSGRRAVLIEADERYCEVIVRRLAQDVLPIGGAV